jgi:hypothetical protein
MQLATYVFLTQVNSFFSFLSLSALKSRVARWFVFKPKIPIWVNFGGPYIGKLENGDIFYGHEEYLMEIFYNHLVHFFRFWYHVPTKKNLATLLKREHKKFPPIPRRST